MNIKLMALLFTCCFMIVSCYMGAEDSVSTSDYGGTNYTYDGDYYQEQAQLDYAQNQSNTQNQDSNTTTINPYITTLEDSLSTFGLDVDAASYTFGRRQVIEYHQLPSQSSVRVEEYINYFNYDYEPPQNDAFAIYSAFSPSPFRDSVQLLRIALKAREESSVRLPWNLTFLVDISGSMSSRIWMVKKSLKHLVDTMQEGDQLSITTYAGGVRTVLEPTAIRDSDKSYLKGVIDELSTGGGTAMADGMTNAYSVNKQGFLSNGINRVVVCTDGDANIGGSSSIDMLAAIKSYVDEGITLSAIGFGTGNYNDQLMENLSNKGDGNYYYIDSEAEAEKVFTTGLSSIMSLIARDAKIQLAFDTDVVSAYRLIGYENRDMADEDFEKDTTDAGEIGSGHTVTALYEIKLIEPSISIGSVRLRYKDLDGGILEQAAPLSAATSNTFLELDVSFKLAILVSEYAEILRHSPYTTMTLSELYHKAMAANLNMSDPSQVEFLEILKAAQNLDQ
ncbi:MAG: von Willebrand factor type A domain-containing protein [Fibrobacterales bacterium]